MRRVIAAEESGDLSHTELGMLQSYVATAGRTDGADRRCWGDAARWRDEAGMGDEAVALSTRRRDSALPLSQPNAPSGCVRGRR